MPLEPIKLKPGLNSVQTPTLLEGGWAAASNIRFFQGLPQKDAGFVYIIKDPAAGIIRALKAWESLSTGNYLGIGGSAQLQVWNGLAVVNISPPTIPTLAELVTLDNWGEFLVACYQGGPIYIWMPTVGGLALNIATAPQENDFIFVATQEQMLIACGSINDATALFDPMLIRWSDVGDYTDWTPSATNQAGSFRLPIGSRITAALAVSGQNLIWSDTCLYSMQYIQFPLVWGFQPLGINFGAVGPHSVGILGAVPFWMGPNQFFTLTAAGPAQIECPVWDQVFTNIDRTLIQYVTCETDTYYGEVGWSVPQLNGEYIFVRLSVATGAWTCSAYHHHTAWIDQNVFGSPIGGHETGWIDQHDVGYDADGASAPWSLTSGIVMIAEGSDVTFVRDLIPDFATDGTAPIIDASVAFYDYPNKPPRVKSGYVMTNTTQEVHPRGRGRGIQFTFSGDDSAANLGTFMRLGNIRVRGQPDGKR